ncbi:MAG: glycoside-pentoside-hexuronide (GPH):cation symporter [Clostridiales bacterium]|nr:glycoside-pentoside-hexuronide (GPH):cation symporter [Clostridiales bacterium]
MANSNTTTKSGVRPFGVRDKFAYMMGDFGNDFTFLLASSWLMKFYSDVMGVGTGVVGIIMMVARFVDAFTDTAMGQIVDRSPATKAGKFIPWMRRFMAPVALASFLMYASWMADASYVVKVIWLTVTYLLWGSICYTGVNIPYGSMASAISDDPGDRVELSTWRNIGSTMASLITGVVLPLVVYYKDADGNSVISGTKFTITALVCSIGALVCYLVCTSLTTERVPIETKTEKFSLGALFKQLFSSRALISIIVAAIVLLLSQLTMTGMSTYVWANYFNNTVYQSVANMVGVVVMLVLAITVVPRASKKYGKKELAIVGNLIAAVSMFAALIIHTSNPIVYIVIVALGYVGIACFNTVIWAMITDVIDEDEVRRGTRSDGTIYSLYSFARKLGQAASAGLTGGLLSMVGYTAATAFDTEVVNGIYNVSVLVPAIGFTLLVIVLAFWYPLDKKTVEANSAELARRKAEEEKQ